MNARSIGQILGTATAAKAYRSLDPNTGQPFAVRCNSYYEGTVEQKLWRRIADGTAREGKRLQAAVLRRARELEIRTRRERQKTDTRCRNGVLGGDIGLRVLEAMFELVDYRTGRLEPSVATLAERIGRSYAATHAALKRLRDAGFLHWVRRSRKTDNSEGPQIEQITNAYALTLPPRVADAVRALLTSNGKAIARWLKDLDDLAWIGPVTRRFKVDGRVGESLKTVQSFLWSANLTNAEKPGILSE